MRGAKRGSRCEGYPSNQAKQARTRKPRVEGEAGGVQGLLVACVVPVRYSVRSRPEKQLYGTMKGLQ
jgi:hypothetical protein